MQGCRGCRGAGVHRCRGTGGAGVQGVVFGAVGAVCEMSTGLSCTNKVEAVRRLV